MSIIYPPQNRLVSYYRRFSKEHSSFPQMYEQHLLNPPSPVLFHDRVSADIMVRVYLESAGDRRDGLFTDLTLLPSLFSLRGVRCICYELIASEKAPADDPQIPTSPDVSCLGNYNY